MGTERPTKPPAYYEALHWEERVFKDVLEAGNRMHAINEIREINRELTGYADLRRQAFYKRFPKFPLNICPGAQRWVAIPSPQDLCNRFTKTPLYRAYDDCLWAHNVAPNEHPVVFVFEVHGIGRIAMHNNTGLTLFPWHSGGVNNALFHSPREVTRGIYLVRTIGNPPVTFVIEQFKTLLALVKTWGDEPPETTGA